MIGLSGLLVKSAQQMVITAKDLKQAGIHLPILVGGAALTKRFTDKKIARTVSIDPFRRLPKMYLLCESWNHH